MDRKVAGKLMMNEMNGASCELSPGVGTEKKGQYKVLLHTFLVGTGTGLGQANSSARTRVGICMVGNV